MYLGSKEYDWTKHPVYSKYTAVDWAVFWIEMYGQIDGSHHKQWLIDQITRILKGGTITCKVASWTDHKDEFRFDITPSEEYNEWQKQQLGEYDEDEDEYEYSYDCGIAP